MELQNRGSLLTEHGSTDGRARLAGDGGHGVVVGSVVVVGGVRSRALSGRVIQGVADPSGSRVALVGGCRGFGFGRLGTGEGSAALFPSEAGGLRPAGVLGEAGVLRPARILREAGVVLASALSLGGRGLDHGGGARSSTPGREEEEEGTALRSSTPGERKWKGNRENPKLLEYK
jgi:hypothetical protein